MLENVVVIGHSFVKYNLGLDVQTTPVYYVDILNSDGVDFKAQIYDWIKLYPDYVKNTNLVLVDLATNDLKSWYKDDGRSLACHMFRAAAYLRNAGAQTVGLFECLYRDGLACLPVHMRAQAATTRFNLSVDEFNNQLELFV